MHHQKMTAASPHSDVFCTSSKRYQKLQKQNKKKVLQNDQTFGNHKDERNRHPWKNTNIDGSIWLRLLVYSQQGHEQLQLKY